jgi:REP element-mobilizing transposase RayT
MDVNTDLNKFTTKDKKAIEYFSSQIINNRKITFFNDIIRKKKEYLRKTVNQDDFKDIEFV